MSGRPRHLSALLIMELEQKQFKDRDEDLLARLGYKQEFKRDFGRLELFGLSFTIVGVVQSIA